MNAIRRDARLRARHGNRRHAQRVQRDGGQRMVCCSRWQGAYPSRVHWAAAHVRGQFDEAVRDTAHREVRRRQPCRRDSIFGHALRNIS